MTSVPWFLILICTYKKILYMFEVLYCWNNLLSHGKCVSPNLSKLAVFISLMNLLLFLCSLLAMMNVLCTLLPDYLQDCPASKPAHFFYNIFLLQSFNVILAPFFFFYFSVEHDIAPSFWQEQLAVIFYLIAYHLLMS